MTVTIVSWNCMGFCTHSNELLNYLDSVDGSPIAICLQECHLYNPCLPILPGYSLVENLRTQKQGGGTCIYIKNEINYAISAIDPSFVASDMEATRVVIKLQESLEITLISIYIPPTCKVDETILSKMLRTRDTLAVGDFNAKNPLWGSPAADSRGNTVIKAIENCNLCYCGDSRGTRINNNGSLSHLDLAFSSARLCALVSCSTMENSWGSDHYPLLLTLNTKNTNSNEWQKESKWNFSKADWDKYEINIHGKLENVQYQTNATINLDEAYHQLVNIVTAAANDAIPRYKGNKIEHKYAPFWDNDCKQAIKERNKKEKIFKLTRLLKDKIEYNKSKAKVKFTIRKAKEHHWETYCKTLNRNSNPTEIWKTIKQFSGKDINPVVKPISVGKINTDQEISNNFSTHFLKMSDNVNMLAFHSNKAATVNDILRTIQSKPKYPKSDIESQLNSDFSMYELQTALESRKVKSASGIDEIPYSLLMKLPKEGKKALLSLINRSWREGKLPTDWKLGIVIPVLKPYKNKDEYSSYRPICLLNTMCKVMEKLVTSRLYSYLDKNNLINPKQAGFQKNKSTIDHILHLKTDAKVAIESGNIMVAVFIDFTRAFDLVWADGLILKLMSLGFSGRCLEWIQHFLSDRINKVKVGDTLSTMFKPENGCPQGSCLSPLLFLVMINDFPSLSAHTKSAIFADDASLWRCGKNVPHIEHHLQEDLRVIEIWCNKWGFQINVEKTNAIMITNKVSPPSCHLTINNKSIGFTKTVKFLGIWFDNKLSWKQHIQHLCEKAQKQLNVMRCLTGKTWGASQKALLMVYKGLILSTFDYGCVVYKDAANWILKKLDAIQYKALLVVTGALVGTALHPMLLETGEIPLRLRRHEMALRYYNKINLLNTASKQELLEDKTFPPLEIKWHNTHKQELQTFYDAGNINSQALGLLSRDTIPHPWSLPVVTVDTSFHNVERSETITACIAAHLAKLELEGNTLIYTDGSKTDAGTAGVGIAIPRMGLELCYRIPDVCSILSTEASAILRALEIVKIRNIQKSVIINDNLRVMEFIQNPSGKVPSIVHRITTYLLDIKPSLDVSLLWIPSHIGLDDHDKADTIAKTGARLGVVDLHYKIEAIDVDYVIHTFVTKSWYAEVITSNTAAKYLATFGLMVGNNLAHSRKCRKEEKTITRLRLRCCLLNKYKFKIGLCESENCLICGVPEDVDHFLTSCTGHTQLHLKLKNVLILYKQEISIKNILSNAQTIKVLLEYIKDNNVDI